MKNHMENAMDNWIGMYGLRLIVFKQSWGSQSSAELCRALQGLLGVSYTVGA